MRRLWPLTPRGTGALVLAIACFVLASELGVAELQYFGMLLIAVLVTSVGSLHLLRRTDAVSRSLHPDVVTVGTQTHVDVRVGLRSVVPTPAGTWRDELPAGLTGPAEGAFAALGSGLIGGVHGGNRTLELTYVATGARRGIHSIGPLTLRCSDPFGLARRSIRLRERTVVTVAPALVDLPALTDLAGESGGMLHTAVDQLGQGADNLIARPYAPGDSMRRIHWRATAHRDELMVRQEEQESTPEATVVLDRSVLRWSADALVETGADPGFETGVSACVSVVARLVRDGYAVDVLDSDGAVLIERLDDADPSDIEELLTRFATIMARRDDHLPRVAQLFAGVMTGPVVVIVGRLDPADATALAAVAHHSALPVLLTTAPVGDALERAADAGWHTGALEAGGDVADPWRAAVGRGAGRVG